MGPENPWIAAAYDAAKALRGFDVARTGLGGDQGW